MKHCNPVLLLAVLFITVTESVQAAINECFCVHFDVKGAEKEKWWKQNWNNTDKKAGIKSFQTSISLAISNASSLAGFSVHCSTEVVNCPGDYNITMHCMHDKVVVDCGDGKWVNCKLS